MIDKPRHSLTKTLGSLCQCVNVPASVDMCLQCDVNSIPNGIDSELHIRLKWIVASVRAPDLDKWSLGGLLSTNLICMVWVLRTKLMGA